jgi:RNA polymerase sigma factor (sigma-70 family)
MTDSGHTTRWIEERLSQIANGDDHTFVRHELLQRASAKIERLVASSLRGRPDLARWEQQEDLLQEVLLRVNRAVSDAKPRHAGQFFVIVAQHVRWATIDLIRRHYGAEGQGRHHATEMLDAPGAARAGVPAGGGSGELPSIDLIELHSAVDRLAGDLRDVWQLHIYLGLTQEQAAEQLGVSSKTIQRRIRAAQVQLAGFLDCDRLAEDEPPAAM